MEALLPDRNYRLVLEAEDTVSDSKGTHSVSLKTFTGNKMSVVVDSKINQNGYIDYTQDLLLVALATLNGTSIDVSNSTFTWTIKNSIGAIVSLSTAAKFENSLKIPSRTLEVNNYYMIEVEVKYKNVTGNAVIQYSTMLDTLYSFEIEPSSGIAFSTDFVMAAVSANIDAELTNFAFGYIKGGKEFLLTRGGPAPIHVVKLPPAETDNKLTVFLKVLTKQEKVIHFEKTVTVSAPTISADNFVTAVKETLADSINNSVMIKMQYEHFKGSMSSSKSEALGLMLDGLQIDGVSAQTNQDEETILTVAQTLETVSNEFTSVNDAKILTRALDIFTKMLISDNDQIRTNKKFLKFSPEAFECFVRFADNSLSAINLVESAKQATVRANVLIGIENALRGSMVQVAPGAPAYIINGSNISILSSKITAKGYKGQAEISFKKQESSPKRDLNAQAIKISLPANVMPDTNYIQVSVISMKQAAYNVIPKHPEGVVKSDMTRVFISETDSVLAAVGSRVYSKDLVLSKLKEPINIEIPYFGTIGTKNTLSCGYTVKDGDTINFTGIKTQILSGSVICSTTHLTDFIVEEHIDPLKSIKDPVMPVEVVEKLNAYKSFAFWLTLFLLLGLAPLVIFAIKKDKRDREKYAEEDIALSRIHVYNTICYRLKSKPEANEVNETQELERPVSQKTDIKATSNAFMNTHVYTSNAEVLKSANRKTPMEEDKHSGKYRFAGDSGPEEEFRKTSNTFKPAAEEDHDDGMFSNIYEKPEPAKVVDNSLAIPKKEQDEIMSKLSRRKKKKKSKPKNEESFLNANIEDAITKTAVEPTKSISKPKEEKKQVEEKKEFQFEPDEEYEGGDDDDKKDDKIKPYDYNDSYQDETLGNTLKPTLGFDDTLKPKKRKLKKKMKKKSKPNAEGMLDPNYSTSSPEKQDPNFLMPTRAENAQKLSRLGSYSDAGNSQNEANITHENDSVNYEQDFRLEEKANRREYTLRFVLLCMLYGYRITNFIFSYDVLFSRLWRLLVFCIEVFFMFFITGVFFYGNGDTSDVGGITGYHTFGLSLLCVVLDRVLHFGILIVMITLKKSSTSQSKYNETENQYSGLRDSSLNITQPNFNQSKQNLNMSGANLEKTKDAMFEESNDPQSKLSNSKSQSKNDKELPALLLMIGVTTCVILFFWIFIIIMSVKYSTRAGQLWGYTFTYSLFFTYLLAEPFYVFATSIFIYRKKWSAGDLL